MAVVNISGIDELTNLILTVSVTKLKVKFLKLGKVTQV